MMLNVADVVDDDDDDDDDEGSAMVCKGPHGSARVRKEWGRSGE